MKHFINEHPLSDIVLDIAKQRFSFINQVGPQRRWHFRKMLCVLIIIISLRMHPFHDWLDSRAIFSNTTCYPRDLSYLEYLLSPERAM